MIARRRLVAWWFLAPALALFAVFWCWPLAHSLWLSLHHSVGPTRHEFIALGNYTFLLHDALFWRAVMNTVAYAAAFVTVELLVALALALALVRPALRGRGVMQFAFFAPHLVGGVFVALLFAVLVAPRFGLINVALDQASAFLHALVPVIPATGAEIAWRNRPELARLAVLAAGWWLSIGYAMMFLVAALNRVDHDLHEAALLDGAGSWERFRQVTLPALWPTLGFLALMGTISAMQLFELPYVLFDTTSGPDRVGLTIVMYLYQQGFQTGDLGYAAAIGWSFTLLLLGLSWLHLRWWRPA